MLCINTTLGNYQVNMWVSIFKIFIWRCSLKSYHFNITSSSDLPAIVCSCTSQWGQGIATRSTYNCFVAFMGSWYRVSRNYLLELPLVTKYAMHRHVYTPHDITIILFTLVLPTAPYPCHSPLPVSLKNDGSLLQEDEVLPHHKPPPGGLDEDCIADLLL